MDLTKKKTANSSSFQVSTKLSITVEMLSPSETKGTRPPSAVKIFLEAYEHFKELLWH